MTEIEIRAAVFPRDLEQVRAVLREYVQSLAADVRPRQFEDELAGLPGKYAQPQGCMLLAWRGEQVLGCVAMRPLTGGDCEMKRLYLSPAARGERLGRKLAQAVCDAAGEAGYRRICLDTLPGMDAAQGLYASLGFEEVPPYAYNPVPGTKYMALALR